VIGSPGADVFRHGTKAERMNDEKEEEDGGQEGETGTQHT
jgi:hypothetical protein